VGSRLVIAVAALALVLCAPAAAATYVQGIDVSRWQGGISWTKVVGDDVDFAFAKATEGTTITDVTYPVNRTGAEAVGIYVGAYHFARPSGSGEPAIVADAIAEADYFLDVAQPQPGELPPVLDMETKGGLSTANLLTWTSAWLDEVYARTGLRPLVYTSPNFWKTSLGDSGTVALNGNPLWVAHWTSAAAPLVPAANWGARGWTFWQFSSTSHVAGIGPAVDRDRFKGASLVSVVIPRYPGGVPAASAPPTILGTAQTGRRLTAVNGEWSGGKPVRFSYQWQRCDASGQGCIPIVGAIAPTYAPALDDVGHALTVAVTATASSGIGSAVSPATTAVTNAGGAAARPAVTSAPAISGNATAGQTLTSSVGGWSGAPTSFAYQWQRCTPQCTAIVGATTSSYTLSPGDIGATVSLVVTATGRGGSTSATTASTGAVAAAPLPAPSSGSGVANGGAAGAVASVDGSATVTWQPGAVPIGSTVTVSTAGTSIAVGVTPAIAQLPWPVDLSLATPLQGAVLGVSTDGIVWRPVPTLPTALLPATLQSGSYVDAGGLTHVLLRTPARVQRFAAGSWGDPRLVSARPPKARLVGRVKTSRLRNGAVVVTARVIVPSQARLTINVPKKTSAKRQQLLKPGGVNVRVTVAGRRLARHAPASLRIAARDPYGRTAELVLPFRAP
jgi:GH25 family lysozyme M1 (1,4-beta-N-acetylmuramidase)